MMKYKKNIISFLLSSILILVLLTIAVSADNSCIDCHEKLSAFDEKQQELNEVRIKHLARDVSCSLECHADILDKIAKSNYEQWTKSKHALFNVTCDNCHGGNTASDVKEEAHEGVARSSDPESSVYYKNVPETCGKCHINELDHFMTSSHFQKLKALKQAPTCDTCHQSHEFKILNVSDFYGLCNNCHNPDMRIAPADAPEKAIENLENAEMLKNEIIKAEKIIRSAKQQGKDVTTAQENLDTAISIRDDLPVQWHSFDLPSFEQIINDGITAAKQAQMGEGEQTTPPSTAGFAGLLSITVIVVAYWLRKN